MVRDINKIKKLNIKGYSYNKKKTNRYFCFRVEVDGAAPSPTQSMQIRMRLNKMEMSFQRLPQ